MQAPSQQFLLKHEMSLVLVIFPSLKKRVTLETARMGGRDPSCHLPGFLSFLLSHSLLCRCTMENNRDTYTYTFFLSFFHSLFLDILMGGYMFLILPA